MQRREKIYKNKENRIYCIKRILWIVNKKKQIENFIMSNENNNENIEQKK